MSKFFVYFPENDDEIVRTNESLTTVLSQIIQQLKGKGEVFYDEENIKSYSLKSRDIGFYLGNSTQQIRIILNKIGAISISSNLVKQNDCCYIIWNFDEMLQIKIAHSLIAEIAERHFRFPDEKYLLLNLQNAISACRERILVFKDAKHLKNLPNTFAHIDFVTDESELQLWLKTNDNQSFSLRDRSRFKRTSFVQQGKAVYEEIATGYFWYLDNLHKNEYEVFDANHNHLGVSNLEGKIDRSKKVEGRVF